MAEKRRDGCAPTATMSGSPLATRSGDKRRPRSSARASSCSTSPTTRSVAAAVETVAAEGGLDVLVNNAGISGGFISLPDVTPEQVERVLATNVLGIVRVTQAFVPLLERSDNPVIVNVSSGMGSLAITTDPSRLESTLVGLAYPTSKAAVNMLTSQYAKGLPGMRVNAVDPGYTGTDFNGHRGTQTVEEGTDAIVRMAKLDASGPTGTFTDRSGVAPW